MTRKRAHLVYCFIYFIDGSKRDGIYILAGPISVNELPKFQARVILLKHNKMYFLYCVCVSYSTQVHTYC